MRAQSTMSDDCDFLDDVPTVANRAKPSAPDGVAEGADKGARIGAYRMVRPSTSDTLACPPVNKTPKPAGKGIVIGVTRKLSS